MTADTKECPFCGEIIKVIAKKCRHCGEFLDSHTRDEVLQEINTGGGVAVGKDVSAGRDFIGRDFLKRLSMSLNPRGGCINITIIQTSIFLISILFLGTIFSELAEIKNVIPSTPVHLPTRILTFTPTAAITGQIHIRIEGVGFAPNTETHPAMRERAAVLAAEIDAKRKLVQWLEGTSVESITIADQGGMATDTIRETVKVMAQDPHVITQHYENETGTATITLELVIDKTTSP